MPYNKATKFAACGCRLPRRYASLKPSLLGSDTATWSTIMRNLFILALIPTLTYAEPGPVTQHLMNEPASLFDVAMLRLRQSIGYWEKQMVLNYKRESLSDISGGNVNAYYQAEDDKIYVVLSFCRLKMNRQLQSRWRPDADMR